MGENLARAVRSILDWLPSRLDLSEAGTRLRKILLVELEGDQTTVAQAVMPSIEIRGIRFWFLLASCIIASVGLNTNSAAVIIGGMLVSPLMGPMIGLGFGLATGSRYITIVSLRNMLWAVAGSLILSTLYFLVSPLSDPTPEILARTAPTLLDLLVAIAAAFAGAIALTSPSLSATLPGVAIATAVMPPLCVTGYGLSQGLWAYALGSFYLFTVNGVAISLVAFLLFKRMHFHETEEDIAKKNTLSQAVVALVLLVFMAPLAWTLKGLWESARLQRNVAELVNRYKDQFEIVNWNYDKQGAQRLVLYAFKTVSPDERTSMENALSVINPKAQLVVRQASDSKETTEVITKFKSSPLYPMLNNTALLQNIANPPASPQVGLPDLERELTPLFENDFETTAYSRESGEKKELLILLRKKRALSKRFRSDVEKRIESWLKVRYGTENKARIVWD